MKAGVERYTAGRAEVTVYFPEGELFCKWCWAFLQCDSDLRRYRCKLTEEPIPDPQHSIGHRCPLIFYERLTIRSQVPKRMVVAKKDDSKRV